MSRDKIRVDPLKEIFDKHTIAMRKKLEWKTVPGNIRKAVNACLEDIETDVTRLQEGF